MNWRDQLRPYVAPEHMFGQDDIDPGPPDVIEQKREHEYREDMIKWEREILAQRAWCRFCYELWTIQFPDALKEEKCDA